MPTLQHTLLPIEVECGVTLKDVAALLPKIRFIENGTKIVFPESTSAALCSSTARCAFGKPAEFAGFSGRWLPSYRVKQDDDAAESEK